MRPSGKSYTAVAGIPQSPLRDSFLRAPGLPGAKLAIVEKVFRLAAEGFGLHAIQNRLYHEGVLSPTGKPFWDAQR